MNRFRVLDCGIVEMADGQYLRLLALQVWNGWNWELVDKRYVESYNA